MIAEATTMEQSVREAADKSEVVMNELEANLEGVRELAGSLDNLE